MRTLEPQANAVMVHATTEMIRAFLRSEGILIIAERMTAQYGSAHHIEGEGEGEGVQEQERRPLQARSERGALGDKIN